MRQLQVLSAAASAIAVTVMISGCSGGHGSSVSGPPVGSGKVQYKIINSFAGSGTNAGQFTYPAGVTLASNGNILVCDYGNGRVEIFNPAAGYVSQIGQEGTAAGDMQSPSDVAISGGNYFITDPAANTVLEYNSLNTFVKNLTTTAPGGFNKPTSITVDPTGNLYVGQSGAILIFNSSGTYTGEITSVGGTALPSLIVAGLAADPSGNLFVLDPSSQSTIDSITPSGTILAKIVTAGVPYSIATDGLGNVFYTDLTNNQIQEYSTAGVLLSTVATSITSHGLAVNALDQLYSSVGTSPGGYVVEYQPS